MLTKPDINWLEEEFLPKLAEKVKSDLSGKLDAINTKLDTFIGEIKARREEQVIHSDQHKTINDRLNTIEKHIRISP
jgi:hypothetical protein